MAHFAKLGSENTVEKVIVVHNNELLVDGVESEQRGVDFLNSLHGTNDVWVQTSYNNNFRKNYAGIGYTYLKAKDVFISPQNYPSWILNDDTYHWEAPVAKPDDGKNYDWNEETAKWVVIGP